MGVSVGSTPAYPALVTVWHDVKRALLDVRDTARSSSTRTHAEPRTGNRLSILPSLHGLRMSLRTYVRRFGEDLKQILENVKW